jgi:hypothetical protein
VGPVDNSRLLRGPEGWWDSRSATVNFVDLSW